MLRAVYRYKRSVLSYLLSHVNALPRLSAQLSLLRSIGDISDRVQTEVLLPTLKALIQKEGPKALGPGEEFEALAMGSFNVSITKDLNDPEGAFWPVFYSALQRYFKPGKGVTL